MGRLQALLTSASSRTGPRVGVSPRMPRTPRTPASSTVGLPALQVRAPPLHTAAVALAAEFWRRRRRRPAAAELAKS